MELATDFATYHEILQQPKMWQQTAQIVAQQKQQIEAFLRPRLAKEGCQVILTGAGTSAFAGALLAPDLNRQLRDTAAQVRAVATTDIVSNPYDVFEQETPTILVSFARSGNSPESVAAVTLANQFCKDISHVIITCNSEGALAVEAQGDERSLVINTPAETNDTGFAMTSSFTSMSLACLLIFGVPVDVPQMLAGSEWMLSQFAQLEKLAANGFDRIIYLGSGALKGAAQECALKTLELTAGQVVALHDSALGFRHGPKAVINPQAMAVVLVSTDPYTRQYDLDIAAELRGNLGEDKVLTLEVEGAAASAANEAKSNWVIPAQVKSDAEAGLLYVLFAQQLAVCLSLRLGLPVDNPFPGGEVNRVVQGVKIHPWSK